MNFAFSKFRIYRCLFRCNVSIYRNASLRTKSPSFNYCLELVEKNDYENFLCALLLPENLRKHALVLRAFNAEISLVEDQITENITGLMRFQFWENIINQLYGGIVPEHPVCKELAKLIQTKQLSKVYLQRMISCRRKCLKTQFKSIKEAEEYSDWSNSSLYFALLELSGVKSIDADHAASHLGKAQGLSIILRSVLRNSRKNAVLLPEEVLLKYGVSHEDILRNKVDVKTKDVAFEMADIIHQHLEKLEQIQPKVTRKTRCMYLPAVPIRCYLKKLRSVDFNMFDLQLLQKDHKLTLKLLYRRLTL